MKNLLSFALTVVLALMFASCGMSTTDSIDQEARWFVSPRGDYACDILSDTVDISAFIPERYFDDEPDDETEPLSGCTQLQSVIYTGDNPVARDYADYYNALIMLHDLYSDKETAERFGEDDANVYSFVADHVAQLDYTIIQNDTLRRLVRLLRNGMESYLRCMPDRDFDKIGPASDHLFEYLTEKVNPSLESSREAYLSYVNRTPFFNDFDSVVALRGTSYKGYQQELLTRMYLAETPEERHMYAIEFAHSDSTHAHFLNGSAVLYCEFFNPRRYSPYLSEMWRTWRASVSTLIGASTWSYIPNLHYNFMRKQVAHIIILHIEDHPDDILAQGVLIDLAGIDNISRYGALFGNAAMLEQMMMFPEWNKSNRN